MFKLLSFVISALLSLALLFLQVRSATLYYLHGTDNNPTSLLQIVSSAQTAESISFKAAHNNLGTAAILFNNTKFRADTHEEIVFRLKESTSQKLLYENSYKINQINPAQHYTFGFPSISDSKDKNFTVEIVRSQIEGVSGVDLSQERDNLILKYDYPKSYMMDNLLDIPYFIANRLANYLSYIPLLHSFRILLVSLIPLLFCYAMVTRESFRHYVSARILFPKHYIFEEKQRYTAIFLAVLYLTAFIVMAILKSAGHTESSEWTMYVVSTLASFILIAVLTYTQKWLTSFTYKTLISLGYILFAALAIHLTFVCHLIDNTYYVFLALSLVPTILISHKNPNSFLETLLLNLVLIFSVVGYFFLDIASFSKNEIVGIIASAALLPLVYQVFARIVPVGSKLLFLLASVVILLAAYYSTSTAIDYHHYSFYVGPAYEISMGKSIFSDVPSQYGYLAVTTVATILKPFGVTFDNFRILNQWLFIAFYFLAYLVIWLVTRNVLISLFLGLVALFFQTQFSLFGFVMAPSTGPLRFGLGLLIVFFVSYFPRNTGLLLSSIVAAVSLFWSAESAVYTVPAYVAMICAVSLAKSGNLKNRLSYLLRYFALFGLIAVVVFLLILFREYQFYNAFPPLLNYIQFATVYAGGWCALLIPVFENYYLSIILLLVGMIYTFRQVRNKNINLLPQLSFITVHNLAIFSYYLSRSHQNNIVNISLFFLLEAILVLQSLTSIKSRKVVSVYILPVSLFLSLFFYTTLLHSKNMPEAPEWNGAIEETVKYYEEFSRTYNLSPNNTIILSESLDSPIVTTYRLKSLLPLNPSLMTTLLPDHKEKYLSPNLRNLKVGTMVVVGSYGEDLLKYLRQHVELKQISTEPGEPFFLYQVSEIKL